MPRCAAWPWPTIAAIPWGPQRPGLRRCAWRRPTPEGALLLRLYRKLDVLPSQSRRADVPPATEADLAALHEAIRDCRPVRFGYTDLSDQKTQRTVLPLALVNPPQGVKLLAWCRSAEDYRQFFVRAMRRLTPQDGDFAAGRMALLQGLVEKEGA